MWLPSLHNFVFTATSTADIGDLSDINDTIDKVGQISTLLNEHGPLIVALAVFIVLFLVAILLLMLGNIWMMKRALGKSDKREEDDQALLAKLLEDVLNKKNNSDFSELKSDISRLDTMLNNFIEGEQNKSVEINSPAEHKDLVKEYIYVSMAFKDVARSAYKKLGCDRLATYVFHNGNKSLHGLPFFKMSCIHEWTQRGLATIRGRNHTEMPLHAYSNFVESLYNTGVYKADDINDNIKNDSQMVDFVAFSDARGFYAVAIKGNDDEVAGFVLAEFSHIECFEDNPERDSFVKATIDEMISYISPIVLSGAINDR